MERIVDKWKDLVNFDPQVVLNHKLHQMRLNPTVDEEIEEEPENDEPPPIKEQWLLVKKTKMQEGKKPDKNAFYVDKTKLEMTQVYSKSEIKAKNELRASEECKLFVLQKYLEVDQSVHENYINQNKKRSENAFIGLKQAQRTELELDVQTVSLTEEKKDIERDLEQIEGVLNQYTHCRDVMFKLSLDEWQEAQKSKETPKSGVEDDNSLSFFTTAPEDLLDKMTELTEQNVSLIQNAPKVDDSLEELKQAIENTSTKTIALEEKVTSQILDLRERVDVMKTSTTKLKQRVQLYDSLKSADEDIMLNSLEEIVSKKYSQCVERRAQYLLSTLEMLAHIEDRVCNLLEQLENIPEEFVEVVLKIKESEKRSRQQEEQLRLERLKKEERLKKCMHRTLKEIPKKRGRKLMPRCIPVETHVKEEKQESESEEDELEMYLFGPKNRE
ncbi:hypothetical protein WMY93_017109 [Mugilogobius chulae]|uniref:DUF4200 domain-containing protein n=1 Tax=Mugilogobius chulae TaxID=88201 RepID=A0AAW0NYB4_9GOBI